MPCAPGLSHAWGEWILEVAVFTQEPTAVSPEAHAGTVRLNGRKQGMSSAGSLSVLQVEIYH